VYEPQEVENLAACKFELAFQFPYNVLDRRFEQISMQKGKRYARSVFLQGLLASPNCLRPDAPEDLLKFQKEYHDIMAYHHLHPVNFAISFEALNDVVDYFLIGVDSAKQLKDILVLKPYEQKDMAILEKLQLKTDGKWLDPREWN
jgi:aryl-alcohol dehydrogenase-like predicted oxidoreductase